ncbi:hypothetical protein [Psychrobacter sp. HII-4]|uniref:hypothetical protein n=1 Tax=Psychrobacter sp. HII-4 TaxID=1569264 RepID=UPI00191AE861|nr:hypothetical protein [Psychrobacter sp. HII-4]
MLESLKALRVLKKINKFNAKGDHEAALKLCNEGYATYASSKKLATRLHAQAILTAKGTTLLYLDRNLDAISNSDSIIRLIAERVDSDLWSAYDREAHWTKIRGLYALKDYEKVVQLIDSISDEYTTYTDSVTECITASMLLLKTEVLKVEGGFNAERFEILRKIVSRYHPSSEPNVIAQVITAISEMLVTCIQEDHYEHAFQMYQHAVSLYGPHRIEVQRMEAALQPFKAYLDGNE